MALLAAGRHRRLGRAGHHGPVALAEGARPAAHQDRAAEERPANGAMQRGKTLEPLARRAYVSHTSIDVEPVCVQSLAYPWMRASLDGLSADGRRVVEIKCPGEKDHQLAGSGSVPGKYLRRSCSISWPSPAWRDPLLELPLRPAVLLNVEPGRRLYRRPGGKRKSRSGRGSALFPTRAAAV